MKEQAGINAGNGGFDISVRGNTALTGAVISSAADVEKNSLSTGTLTYSDVQNRSHYDATSNGASAGVGIANTGKAVGPGSGSNRGGVAPMLPQSDSGAADATTRTAVSAGAITVTDGASQRQDVANLSRDTTNTNGTVSKLPDVSALLNEQGDRMNAAQAAGQAVAQRIGDYADAQARATGDSAWAEGGSKRAEMQAAGAAVVAGLGGGVGSAVAGAAGAGIGSKMGGELNKLSDSIAASNLTGDANMNAALGNIVANVVATGAGAAVGGAGAFGSSTVDLYNRQMHSEEKTLAKRLADNSGGLYTQTQVEEQMRIMGVSTDGNHESGAPETLIGQAPSDSGARWISAGTTADGKPILTQVTAQADPELQAYILANYNSTSRGDVPSQFTYDRPTGTGSWNISGPFTKFDQSDTNFVRSTTADGASMISTNAGRISAAAGAAAAVPGVHQPAAASLAAGSGMVGLVADAVAQIIRPDPAAMFKDDIIIGVPSSILGDRYPMLGPVINEVGEYLKGVTSK
ncbi:hemolysin [Paraburkholderia sp. EG287A]|uniref:hemolysin n=1 Tax=unclassified Paraburkholderia TaxID=2615204 RepID=UPI0034D1ED59